MSGGGLGRLGGGNRRVAGKETPHAPRAFAAPLTTPLGRGLQTERFRLVEWGARDPATEIEYDLYDYAIDPLKTWNLAGGRPDVVRQIVSLLAAEPAPVPPGSQPASPPPR